MHCCNRDGNVTHEGRNNGLAYFIDEGIITLGKDKAGRCNCLNLQD